MRWARCLVLAALVAAGCGDDDAPGAVAGGEASALAGTVTVFAAASLTEAFAAIGTAFEERNPGLTVTFNFAGSSALAEQVNQGAPADVLATADMTNMQKVVDDRGVEDEPETFARNRLAIAVPAGNPGGVTDLTDLARPELLVGLCAEEVPCGRYAREALGNAGVTPSIDTNEPDVRALLTRIEAGELDAGVVYLTDVIVADDAVESVDIPAEHNVIASYPVAVLTDAPTPQGAAAFVDFVTGARAAPILREFGFIP